jgi:hypothetical protein
MQKYFKTLVHNYFSCIIKVDIFRYGIPGKRGVQLTRKIALTKWGRASCGGWVCLEQDFRYGDQLLHKKKEEYRLLFSYTVWLLEEPSFPRNVFLSSEHLLLVADNVVPRTPTLTTLMLKAPHSFESSVLTRATRRTIPEDCILHSNRREILKSYTALTGCIM